MKLTEKMTALMRETGRLLSKRGSGSNSTPGSNSGAGSETMGTAPGITALQRRLQETLQGLTPKSRPNIPPIPQAQPVAKEAANDLVSKLLAGLGLSGRGDWSKFDGAQFDGAKLDGTAWAPQPQPQPQAEPNVETASGGRFIAGSYSNQAGTRTYKLYIPSAYTGQDGPPLPLVVMLHGCTQNPDDFAAGTNMNALAEQTPCFVVYPAQTQSANSSKCWNWFNAIDQQRDQGEPSIIAGITRDIIAGYPVDAQQVYIAGLSAGGAMAAIMGATYPDLYAAIGVHSGLPYAVAHDLPSALAAMGGRAGGPGRNSRNRAAQVKSVPVIVFHGDKDKTVHPQNGDQVMAQSVSVASGNHLAANQPKSKVQQGQVANGHAYTRTTHHDERDAVIGEHWLVHGAAHAWSGGSQRGSYTDARGPDASQEMMRFFATQGRAQQ